MMKIFYLMIAMALIFCACSTAQKQEVADGEEPVKVVNEGTEKPVSEKRGKYILIKDMNSGRSWKLTYKQWKAMTEMVKK